MTDTDAEKAKKLFSPILLYLGGLLASSTILTAAAISALKDASPYSDWQRALCGFLFWMTVTILIAVIGAAIVQHRLAYRKTTVGIIATAAIYAPILPGLGAAAQIIGFALSHHHPLHFW